MKVVRRDTELCHFGILGQKWGVRRYQNKDGSLTNAGRERYLKNIDKSDLDYSHYNKAFNDAKSISEKFVNKHDEGQSQRIKDAAETALNALDSIGEYDIGYEKHYRDETEDTKKSVRDWLIYEDQTIGYVEVADLANQGKDAKQIHKILKEAYKKSIKFEEAGNDIVDQVKNKYLSELETKYLDWKTRRYVEDKVLNTIDNYDGLWDLTEFYDTLEVVPSDYFKAKYNRYIDACVAEASKKKK